MPMFNNLCEITWDKFFGTRSRFNVNTLTIPEYQRSYVWDDKKISSLLNGIILSCRENKDSYFLGNIILCKEKDSDSTRCFDYSIVDGQQRLTSLTIIASTIRQMAHEKRFLKVEELCTNFIQFDDEKKNALYNLTLPDPVENHHGAHFRAFIQEKNYDKLKNYVESNDECSVIMDYMLLLQRNFSAVYDILYGKSEQFLRELIQYISGKCKFVIQVTDDFINAHSVFCTINLPGEQLSPLDFFKARFYGHLISQKGVRYANRNINTKSCLWTRIYKELGAEDMKCFLAHVYRIEIAERFSREQFISSYNLDDAALLQFFNMYTTQMDDCDRFLKRIADYFDIWMKIFKFSGKLASKEVLKMLRGNHFEVWITIALAAGHNLIRINDDFWKKLEKFMTILMVLVSNRYTSQDVQAGELLSKCHKEIRLIIDFKRYDFPIRSDDISLFIDQIKGNALKTLNDLCINYLLMRANVDSGNDLKIIDNYLSFRYHTLYPLDDIDAKSTDWIAKHDLKETSYHLGNLILINLEDYTKFHNKNWKTQKAHAVLVRNLSLSYTALSHNEWTIDAFKATQEKYVRIIGALYKIDSLINYEYTINRKRKIEVKNEVTEVAVAVVAVKQPKKEITAYEIGLAANELNVYLRNIKNYTEDGLKTAAMEIDPDQTGQVELETAVALLVKLQKTHKIYYRKWGVTLQKWAKNVCNQENMCNYPQIFIRQNPL